MALDEFRDAKPADGRRGFSRLTALGDARRELLSSCRRVKSTSLPFQDLPLQEDLPLQKDLPLQEAIGRVAAETIVALGPVPTDAIALRDGFAVSALDTIGASAYAPTLILTPPRWVSCGDRLPQSTDAILPAHAVRETAVPAEILAQATPGDGVRFANGDIPASAVIVAAGERINSIRSAVLRAAGFETVKVRIPRVAIIVRNDLPQGDLAGLCFRDMAQRLGASAELVAIDMSDLKLLARTMAAVDADLIMTIGGTGFGERDCTAPAIAQVGALLVHGLALHPGETAGFGLVSKPSGSIPVIMAPGRLEAAFAVWLALAKPALCETMAAVPENTGKILPLARKITSNPGVSDIVLLQRVLIDDTFTWEALASSDLPWHALARAQAWHIVPPESEGYAQGSLLCAEEI